jgi:hypothetical protein
VEWILRRVLGVLAELVIIFARNMRAARADDPRILAVGEDIVNGITRDHPEWTAEEKRSYAAQALKEHARILGKDLKDSLVNSIVELLVQKTRA